MFPHLPLFGLLAILWTTSQASSASVVPGRALEQPSKPRIVLFVLFDTLGAGHVTHLGYDRATTPRLDALGEHGVQFLNAVSPAPYAVASIPALLTGRYPDRIGRTGYEGSLAQDETTLAEQLQAAGYRTVGLSSVYNGGPAFGNDQGFDHFVEMYRGPGPEGARRLPFQGETCHFPSPAEYVEPVRAELDALEDDGRLFLFVHFLQPHAPYHPPPRFLELFRDGRFPGPYDPAERDGLRKRTSKGVPNDADREALIHLYDANVAQADAGLGLVLDELKQRGLYDEALVVATGNHGEAFWEHDMHGHGVELFEELMHVPLVLKLPKSDGIAGLQRGQLVSNLDATATLLERLHLSAPKGQLDGRSLLGLLGAQEAPAGHERLFLRSEPKPGVARKIGLRWAHEKVIVTLGESESGARTPVSSELYNLIADPREHNDLGPRDPERLARATREAFEFYQSLQASAADAQRDH